MVNYIKKQFTLLDLCCGAGGASKGYWIAGINPTGIDIAPQKNYPYEFTLSDILDVSPEHVASFDVVHASPPCQAYSSVKSLAATKVDLIPNARELIFSAIELNPDLMYVIENVEGAPLVDPIMLCGATFGLTTYRHRFFETNFNDLIVEPPHTPHIRPQGGMGRRAMPWEFVQVIGTPSDVMGARQAMGISWMTGKELSQAVPPAYTAYLGSFIRNELDRRSKGKPLFASKTLTT